MIYEKTNYKYNAYYNFNSIYNYIAFNDALQNVI